MWERLFYVPTDAISFPGDSSCDPAKFQSSSLGLFLGVFFIFFLIIVTAIAIVAISLVGIGIFAYLYTKRKAIQSVLPTSKPNYEEIEE